MLDGGEGKDEGEDEDLGIEDFDPDETEEEREEREAKERREKRKRKYGGDRRPTKEQVRACESRM